MSAAADRNIERAKRAYERVQRASTEPWRGEYGSRLRELPAMLLANGFGQTVVFYISKSGNGNPTERGYQRAWQDLIAGIGEAVGIPQTAHQQADALMSWLGGKHYTSATARLALIEALAFSGWIKRWAEALIGDRSGSARSADQTEWAQERGGGQ